MSHSNLLRILVALMCVGAAARADIVESFEGGGLPAGWTLGAGSVGGVSGAVPNLSPTAGAQFGFISNAGTTSTAFTGVSGTTAGSILVSPVFTLDIGSTLTMDLNFVTNDGGGFNDYALVLLLDGGVAVATLYSAQTKSVGGPDVVPGGDPALGLTAGVVLTPLTVGDFDGIETGPLGGTTYGPSRFGGGPGGSTGWVTSTFVVSSAGSYQLLFLVSDVSDTGVDSALAFDNINTAGRVPEPGMSVLLGAGLIAVLRRFRRTRRALAR